MKKKLGVFLVTVAVSAIFASGQAPYKLPPKEVIDILDAPPFPRAGLSPRGDLMFLAEYQAMPRIADLAQPLLRIAGLRITPRTNSRQQMTFYTALSLVSLRDGKTRQVALPEGIKMGFPQWSPDGRWIAFARYRRTAPNSGS